MWVLETQSLSLFVSSVQKAHLIVIVQLSMGGKDIKSRCGLLRNMERGHKGLGHGQNIHLLLIAEPLVCVAYQQGSKG